MADPEQKAQDAPGEIGGGFFALHGLGEEVERGQGLQVDPFRLEDLDQLMGQRLDLGGPAFVQEQGRHLLAGQGHVVPHLPGGEFPPRLVEQLPLDSLGDLPGEPRQEGRALDIT